MVESVVINTSEENAGPTLEEQAAAMDATVSESNISDLPSDSDGQEDRPDWLPEKFSSPEEMAKSYASLEAKMSEPQEEAEAPEMEEAQEAVENAGLDFDALSDEYYAEGGLSDEAYETLAKAGIPEDIVNQYISATEQAQNASRQEVMSNVGGEEEYNEMLDWASDNLSDSEIDSFNNAVSSQDYDTINLAVKGLAAMRGNSTGMEPKRNLSGAVGGERGGEYNSVAEMMTDMNDPRYAKDPAFRSKVESKLSRSNIM
tara:strand:- start:629 stop:1405 length:777 start_codon:yes stop_codon:yes gene_type:complete